MKEGECIKQKLGTCTGCPVLDIGVNKVRWRGYSVNKARILLLQEYCPKGESPDLDNAFNSEASYGLGQRREENLIGTTDIRPNKRSGRKISKKKTLKWFW